jgi:DNA-binding transcriptional LysR family regulator
MHPSIRAINIFVSVVETKSFAATARAVLTDPSVVSRAIKSLEDELGIVLFARSTRALRLTDEGARFYRDCAKSFRNSLKRRSASATTERSHVDGSMSAWRQDCQGDCCCELFLHFSNDTHRSKSFCSV